MPKQDSRIILAINWAIKITQNKMHLLQIFENRYLAYLTRDVSVNYATISRS